MDNGKALTINMISQAGDVPISYGQINSKIIEYLQRFEINTSKLDLNEDIVYDPLEIILEQVMNHKISSKDINIIELADFYISILYTLKKFDVRESGRVIYRAAKLLKIKANELKIEEEKEEYDFLTTLLEDDEFMGDLCKNKKEIPNHYKSDDIVLSMCWEASRKEYLKMLPGLKKTKPKMDFFDRPSSITTEQIISIAHEEDILTLKDNLYKVLVEMFKQNGSVPFTQLTESIESAKSMIFITLLHLATDRKIWLAQDETYNTELMIFPPVQIKLETCI